MLSEAPTRGELKWPTVSFRLITLPPPLVRTARAPSRRLRFTAQGSSALIRPRGNWLTALKEQATQAFKNLRAVITEAGLTMADIVKVTIFLTDMANFDAVNKAMKTFVPAPFPARSCFAVAALPKGGLVEIEAIVDRIGQPF